MIYGANWFPVIVIQLYVTQFLSFHVLYSEIRTTNFVWNDFFFGNFEYNSAKASKLCKKNIKHRIKKIMLVDNNLFIRNRFSFLIGIENVLLGGNLGILGPCASQKSLQVYASKL